MRMYHEGVNISKVYLANTTVLDFFPVVSLIIGNGDVGSVFQSTFATQWYADGVAIPFERGITYTRTAETTGSFIRQSGSNQIGPFIFDFSMLFAAGEQGVIFDPSDISTLFQDAAGTIPVTTAGDPVGRMLDLSGNGNHATQATAAQRPIYQTDGTLHWLAFDGVDDAMATPSIDFTGTDEMSVFAGAKKLNVAGAVGPIVLNADTGTTAGSFALYAPHSATNRQFAWSISGSSQGFRAIDEGLVQPQTAVMSLMSKISSADPSIRLLPRLNGIIKTAFSVNLPGGAGANFRNDTIRIGEQGTSRFKGNIYAVVVRGKTTDAATIDSSETLIAEKTGVTL